MSHPRQTHAIKLTKRQIFWLLGIAALATAIAFAVNGPLSQFFASSTSAGEDVATQLRPLAVNVGSVEFVETITQARAYTGTIRARHRSDLGFELSGKIESVAVDEGDQVSQGQVLAKLDTETLDAQKSAILARLDQAKSVMAELDAGPREERVLAAKASVDAAQSNFSNAQLNLSRRKRLKEAAAISSEEYDQALFAERSARANLTATQEQLAELETGTRKEKIAAQLAAVRQLEASAKEIEVAISKSDLTAPFDGTVTRRYLDQGSIANASAPVIKLVEQQHLEAWIGVPVSIASDIEKGAKHEIRIGKNTFFGQVSAKIQELDPVTLTQTVVFELEPAASQKVVSGQVCETNIASSVDTAGCWIPTSALTKGVRGLWSVMVIVPDESEMGGYRAEKRDIEILKTDANRILASGTIGSGDRIVIDGVHRIGEGQWVVPTDE